MPLLRITLLALLALALVPGCSKRSPKGQQKKTTPEESDLEGPFGKEGDGGGGDGRDGFEDFNDDINDGFEDRNVDGNGNPILGGGPFDGGGSTTPFNPPSGISGGNGIESGGGFSDGGPGSVSIEDIEDPSAGGAGAGPEAGPTPPADFAGGSGGPGAPTDLGGGRASNPALSVPEGPIGANPGETIAPTPPVKTADQCLPNNNPKATIRLDTDRAQTPRSRVGIKWAPGAQQVIAGKAKLDLSFQAKGPSAFYAPTVTLSFKVKGSNTACFIKIDAVTFEPQIGHARKGGTP